MLIVYKLKKTLRSIGMCLLSVVIKIKVDKINAKRSVFITLE